LLVFPPHPAKYPPNTLLVGFFDLPMYKISETGVPVSVVSIKTKIAPLLNGKLEKVTPFNGTNSEKPFPLRVKEFMSCFSLGIEEFMGFTNSACWI